MKHLFRLFVIAIFFISGLEAYSQEQYQHYVTEDGVVIDYKWSHSKLLNKTSPLELRLRIKNTNEHAVNLTFVVDYYMGPLLHESSEEVELCIRPGALKLGKMNGVYFVPETLSNEQIRSEEFKLEINGISVTKTEECPAKS